MGFDLCIGMKMNLNPETGLPYVGSVAYAAAANTLVVPDVFRKFIHQRGPDELWKQYIKHFNADYEYETPVSEFLEYYPAWSEILPVVSGTVPSEDDWSESDHDMFKAALIWFRQKGCFYVSWSY